MTPFIAYRQSGEIVYFGSASTERQALAQNGDGAFQVAFLEMPDGAGTATHYVDGDAVTERPVLAALEAGAAPYVLDLADYPEGTAITARNNAGDTATAATDDPIRLTAAGTYRVTITPPFPTRPIEQDVTVA